jgi:hypothetical protein
MQTGTIQEISNLFVTINDTKVRYSYLNGVDMCSVGDAIEYETDEREVKGDPGKKMIWFTSFRRADTPRAAEAFTTADKIVREVPSQGVVVTETVKKPVEQPQPVTKEQWKQMNPTIYKDEIKQTPQGAVIERTGVSAGSSGLQFMQALPPTQSLPPKDVLIVRQTCLQRAIETISAGATPEEVLKFAEVYEKWVLRK